MTTPLIKKLNLTYAFAQGTYWFSEIGLGGYITVFLLSRGMDDTLVAYVTSALAIVAIVMQMVIANYCDHHPILPLKNIILGLYLVTIVFCGLMYWISLSLVWLIVIFVIAVSAQRSIESLLNAQMMQFVNKGLGVSYSWPRGVGSFCYALGAFGFGVLFDYFSPDILLPITMVISIFAIVSDYLLPDPETLDLSEEDLGPSLPNNEAQTSYFQMLKGNPLLVIYLLASIACAVGLSGYNTFLIRIVENLGGSNTELGIAMLVQSTVELPAMFLATKLLRKYKPVQILFISYFFFWLKGIGMIFVPNLGSLYGLMLSSFFCYGFYGFGSVIFVNEIVKVSEKIRAQSLSSLCFVGGVGGILGNAFCGWILAGHDLHYLLVTSQFFGLASVILMFMAAKLYKQNPKFSK